MLTYNNFNYENLSSVVSISNCTIDNIKGKIFYIKCTFNKGYFKFFLNELHDNDFTTLENKEYKGSLYENPIIDIIEFCNNVIFETMWDGEYYIKFSNIIDNKINIYLTIKDDENFLLLETDLEVRRD